jgi:hypothetical protein
VEDGAKAFQPLVPRLERVFKTVTADHDDLYLMIAGSRSVVPDPRDR